MNLVGAVELPVDQRVEPVVSAADTASVIASLEGMLRFCAERDRREHESIVGQPPASEPGQFTVTYLTSGDQQSRENVPAGLTVIAASSKSSQRATGNQAL